MSLRLAIVVGARPQFIKYGPVYQALKAKDVEQLLIHTGQHYDKSMSDMFFEQLELPRPDYNLGICNSSHSNMSARMMIKLEEIFFSEKIDGVLVFGDTNSTLAASLVVSKIDGLDLIHVEAGLRSYNRKMPEEINRVITDHVSNLLFCPTRVSVANLKNEGVKEGVHLVGDVMYDATLSNGPKAPALESIFKQMDFKEENYVLATVHRAENTDDPRRLAGILGYIGEHAEAPVLMPLHPRTQKRIQEFGIELGDVHAVGPVGYLEMITLIKNAKGIYTDSGGMQKEAYFLRTPCVTLRDETEWIETVNCGWNRLWFVPDFQNRTEITEYGTGNAAEIITDIICQYFRK
jgi:UDP-GlcNAc3NAcA epimerase